MTHCGNSHSGSFKPCKGCLDFLVYSAAEYTKKYTNMSQALILPQYPGDFSLTGHTHNYASSSHSHSQYLTSHQSLTNYATKTYVDNAVAGIDTSTVPSHTHDYASSSHTHSYASTSHTHSGYASSTHSHTGYASSSHSHSDYATQDWVKDYVKNNGGSNGNSSSDEISISSYPYYLTKTPSRITVTSINSGRMNRVDVSCPFDLNLSGSNYFGTYNANNGTTAGAHSNCGVKCSNSGKTLDSIGISITISVKIYY